jgi:Protein of unknown function (DUF2845)
MNRLANAVLPLAALLVAGTVSAETFRCGQYIASPDMSVDELLEKCGEPTQKTSEVVDVYARGAGGGRTRTGTTTIEKWTYDRGSGSFAMVVTIEGGKIKAMEHAR